MARCDEGYRCEVCGRDVEEITDSDLYLRYVLSEVPLERLHLQRERHVRCNPALAQFIVDSGFEPAYCEGAFANAALNPAYGTGEDQRGTRGWKRLMAITSLGLTIA